MKVLNNIGLAKFTTFFIGGSARYFISATDLELIREAVRFANTKQLPILVLGEGSNLLISDKGFDGVVIKTENLGIEVLEESNEFVRLEIASGESWDKVVDFCVKHGWWGIENLSHIPGTVGAFCVQNVGAYGQEASQVVEQVQVLNTKTLATSYLSNRELNFGYRKSVFNTSNQGLFIIITVVLRLNKTPSPNLAYGDLSRFFHTYNIVAPSITEIRKAIIKIRDSKFPYPKEATNGNSGSFFRGPILSEKSFTQLKHKIEENFGSETLTALSKMEDRLKVPQGYKTPAAFLIDICKLKEESYGGAKINFSQPTVILNHTGKASSNDVLFLYKRVADIVQKLTGVWLGIEPELVGFTPKELDAFLINSD